MNPRQKRLLEGINAAQARDRRRHGHKQGTVDRVLESIRGARPTDALAGVDIQDETPGDEFAPVAANLEVGDEPPPEGGEMDIGAELDIGGEAPAEGGEITQEMIDSAVETAGLKPVSIEGIDMAALEKGTDHEMEHVEDRNVAAAIAAHHIVMGQPDYYDKLDEVFGEEEPTDEPPAETDETDFEELTPGDEDSEEEEEAETDEPKGDEEGDN